jgi:bifunctional enzyme CysN/CysC
MTLAELLDDEMETQRAKPLRFATVGSVDDGKSTLIGRLLHDSKSIFEDQLEHIEAVSKKRGTDYVDLALLTDGLRAEREQGITIDVAYRYFSTPHRDFVIADCPGHVQYTRNAITGASTADLAIVLVDARHGVVEQTRRHSLLMSLLGVPHLVICVNKMDLVGHSAQRFAEVREEFTEFAARLDLRDVTFIPISALAGDNVVERSTNMAWYEGPTLLHHLETVYTASDDNLIDVRFPVQYVVRPQRAEHHDYRGYAGAVAAGTLRPGDEVAVLPSGMTSRIERIDTADGPVAEARPGMAVTLLLTDDLDVSRGDMICRPHNQPTPTQDLDAMVAWMDSDHPLALRKVYTLKHTTRSVRAMVTDLRYRLDVSSLHREEGVTQLALNEIGRVTLRATAPLFADDYRRNRITGSFVLIDEATNQTAAAGMLRTSAG